MGQYAKSNSLYGFDVAIRLLCKVVALDRWGGKWNHLSM